MLLDRLKASSWAEPSSWPLDLELQWPESDGWQDGVIGTLQAFHPHKVGERENRPRYFKASALDDFDNTIFEGLLQRRLEWELAQLTR